MCQASNKTNNNLLIIINNYYNLKQKISHGKTKEEERELCFIFLQKGKERSSLRLVYYNEYLYIIYKMKLISIKLYGVSFGGTNLPRPKD